MQVDQMMMPSLRVASFRRVGPYGPQVGEAFCKLAGWAMKNQLFNERALMIGAYYDCPDVTPPEQCRMDACITLSPDAAPQLEDGIIIQTLAGGHCATTLCSIYNHDFKSAWKKFGDWMAEHKGEWDDRPALEIYYGPCSDYHPLHKYVVDLVTPLKSAIV